MSEVQIWGSGCGVYNFRHRDGSISMSVGLVDASLDEEAQRVCLSYIAMQSFGIGSGAKGSKKIPLVADVFKHAYVLNVASGCDRKYYHSVQDVKECINSELGKLDLNR